MFLIEIAGLKVFFTGDYSRENDRHLIPAEVPKNIKIDVLITESTYGVSQHIPRVEREAQLMKLITGVLNRGGRALLPVAALGRAQELLLILDDYWAKHPEYQKIPIYYASNLARKCMIVYQTYISAMNDNIKRMFRERISDTKTGEVSKGGPWDFRFIRSLKSLERFEDVGGCVMLASPGMLQSGVSRELLERWAPDQKNGVIITGYSVEGTMAQEIGRGINEIPAITARVATASAKKPPGKDADQVMIPLRCMVEEISFAAHVDGQENREFIEEVNAPVVILVHGAKGQMIRLKSKLTSVNNAKPATERAKIFTPANCEEVRIPIRIQKTARIVGRLAERIKLDDGTKSIKDGQLLSGVLVQNDLKISLMAPEDLREYAGLTTTTIMCRQKVTLASASIDLIRWALEGTFGGVADISPKAINGAHNPDSTDSNDSIKKPLEKADEEVDRSEHKLRVMDAVNVSYRNGGEIEVEWEGNMMNDGIADAVLALLMTVESSPAAVKHSSKLHNHSHGGGLPNGEADHADSINQGRNPHANADQEERLSRLMMFLEAQFGSDNVSPIVKPRLTSDTASEMPIDTKSEEEAKPVNGAADASATEDLTEVEAAEIKRLHSIGIPVPGIKILVDKLEAKLWLETMDVESSNKALKERVLRVADRAIECLSGLWMEST